VGLIPAFCRALIMQHKRVAFRGPVLTLGNQDIWANHEQLKSYFDELGCPYEETEVVPRSTYMVEALAAGAEGYELKRLADAQGYVHARTFFGMMGITDYCDIDKLDFEQPQIVHDLNAPVPPELRDRFNLIVDSGTIEHIFDVRQVMENVVRMSRVGGWVVHITPSSNYVDHGFFSFSPCFFYDFYRANGFTDFTCYLLQVDPRDHLGRAEYVEYSYGMNLSELIRPGREVLVFFAARKAESLAELVVPVQGVYRPERAAGGAAGAAQAALSSSLTNRFVPAPLRAVLSPLRPLLWRLRRKVVPDYKLVRKRI
jgi:hypothetical protein